MELFEEPCIIDIETVNGSLKADRSFEVYNM